MPRGGARSVSGPAPDPNALRRNRPSDKAGWLMLPAEGRHGLAPEWPLVDQQLREADLWNEMWSRPQALAWEELGLEYEVALFVRKLGEAEQPGTSTELAKVVRGYMDSLGLSTQGMLRNRWRIAPAAEIEEPARTAEAPRRPSARDRLKVVRDGEGT